MTISDETKKRIEDFSREQSRFYLDRAHMTYWEKLQSKAEQTQRKVVQKASQFKFRSQQSEEAQGDLMLYMNDFVEDLIAQGATEDEAFARARRELACDSGTNAALNLQDLYAEKIFGFEPFDVFGNEMPGFMGGTDMTHSQGTRGAVTHTLLSGMIIGFLFAGFTILGVIVGALIGFLGSGGIPEFLADGWIATIIGLVVGAVIGVGLALLCSALVVALRRK